MRILIFLLIFISSLFSAEIMTEDNRSYSLKLHTFGWDTNWNKHTIDYEELQSGGPSRDGIPPIDKPIFETVNEAKSWIGDNEPLIFVTINKETKAYPLQVLMWHEIVNDTLSNKDISITFCPLCNASIVFDRNLDGVKYDFGTSGLLRNSDLVMYDRQTESLWQQFTGSGIVGDMSNKTLQQIPSLIVSFKDVYTNYPNTKILSKKTGYYRNYGKNPYVGYDDINQSPFMLKQATDKRLFPMQRVATVTINDKNKAYAYSKVKKLKVINDSFERKSLVLFYKTKVTSALNRSEIARSKDVGSVLVYYPRVKGKKLEFYYDEGFYDKQTHSQWNIFGEAIAGKLKGEKLKTVVFGSHFWFAWAVFKPDTVIYK